MTENVVAREYVLNRETNKIELRFSKEEYKALPEADKTELKRFFLFSGKASAWVSRSTNNHYSAIRTAEKLGFTDAGKVGERLSYAEQVERKAEKAEARADRFEEYAGNAEKRAEGLQSEFNELRGDWSWITQPNINSSAGRSFTRQREKIMARYDRGFEEYRKSEYYQDRAATARSTADLTKLQSKRYLNNRIEESKTRLRELERRIVQAEGREEWLEKLLELMEIEMDKLAFHENCLEEIGGVEWSKDNIKPGYLVKIRGSWDVVIKANPKTVEAKPSVVPYTLKYAYAEIQDMKIPENWTDPSKAKAVNPFSVGDILTASSMDGKRIRKAFQVVKATDKNVMIQEIQITDGAPVANEFISDKQERRAFKERYGSMTVNYDDYTSLHKYSPA